jgi:ubiquinone/menaquinone biosynthesis C-methylase UbiE
MKLNWAERLVVNNAPRVWEQRMQLRWMGREAVLTPEARVLEIGCGRGAGACAILEKFHPAAIHAMDLDIAMIRMARKYIPAAMTDSIGLHVASATHLPYAEGVFDAVFGFGVLHHVVDWRSALGEIGRVLKPGGIYFIEELYPTLYQNFITKHILLHPTEDRFSSGDLKEALAGGGFSIRKSLELQSIGILAVCDKTAA